MQTKSLALSFELLNLKRRANRLARRAEGTAGGSYRHWWPRHVILRRSRRCNLRRCRVFRWLLLREFSGAALLPLLLLDVDRRRGQSVVLRAQPLAGPSQAPLAWAGPQLEFLAQPRKTWLDCRSATQNYLHGRAGRPLSRPSPELSWQSRRLGSGCCRELQGGCQSLFLCPSRVPVSGITGPISGRSVGFDSDGVASNGPEGRATGTRLLI